MARPSAQTGLNPRDLFGHAEFYRKSAELLVASPDVAILLYRVTYASGMKGSKPDTATVSAADTYVRRGGKWLSLYYQETHLK